MANGDFPSMAWWVMVGVECPLLAHFGTAIPFPTHGWYIHIHGWKIPLQPICGNMASDHDGAMLQNVT